MRWVALLLLVGCSTLPSNSTVLAPAHRAAIVDSVASMVNAWRDAFNARDFARAASYYSSDTAFRWFENGELKFRTARELRDTMLAEAPRLRAMNVTLVGLEITAVAPGVAEVSTGFAEKVTDEKGDIAGYAGSITMTAVHGDSGWKFLVGHSSLVAPLVDSTRGLPRKA